ncbi:hypothetical protein [Neogemmobacter tilapiae]|uniref:hypothetical protein n=1 Tax=Neogemmobacter tilapiae TaxID=875041 RepID=UPI00167820A8|nr:hypothetical protein [Gemmobacter tilapiae]
MLPPPFDSQLEWWAKADLVTSVSYTRLDLFRSARLADGRRKYISPKISETQFSDIRAAVLRGLRFDR